MNLWEGVQFGPCQGVSQLENPATRISTTPSRKVDNLLLHPGLHQLLHHKLPLPDRHLTPTRLKPKPKPQPTVLSKAESLIGRQFSLLIPQPLLRTCKYTVEYEHMTSLSCSLSVLLTLFENAFFPGSLPKNSAVIARYIFSSACFNSPEKSFGSMARAVICLPDNGFDPTQAALPWHILTSRGCSVDVATEYGDVPACDKRMFQGMFGRLFTPNEEAVAAYHRFASSDGFRSPRSWSSPDFSLIQYDCVILPGGFGAQLTQMANSKLLQRQLMDFVPHTLENGPDPPKICAASGHGVLCLAFTKDQDGISLLHQRRVTTLPMHLERLERFATDPRLGICAWMLKDFAGTSLRYVLEESSQYQCGPFVMSGCPNTAFVARDAGLLTSRWQGDSLAWGEAISEELMKLRWQE